MNLDRMISLTEGIATKADKIRALDRGGYSRADIARFLGIRYQHVRNTLEADKRTGYNPEIIQSSGIAGSAVTPISSSQLRAINVDDAGCALIPPDILESLGDYDEGEAPQLYALKIDGGLFVCTGDGLAARASKSLA